MKFMIFVKANPDIEARLAKMSDSEMKDAMAEMEVFNTELRKAGVMKDCDGLRPSREGKRVRFDGKARTVADACILFEQFAATLDLPLRSATGRVLLHGHCHQKAMGMLPATVALLSRIPNASIVELDAGCCGMAGSFGFEAPHYDLSIAVGERVLLPAARSRPPDALIVADGFSCREQLAQAAGRQAKHLAEVLRQAQPNPR